jgi:hypothetical protein
VDEVRRMKMSSGTVMDQAIDRIVSDVSTDQNWFRSLWEITNRLNTGFYNGEYVNTIMQPFRHSRYDMNDAYVFGNVHAKILSGEIVTAKIYVGSDPAHDDQIFLNQQKLNRLPFPFSAEFAPQQGGGAHDDGVFEWEQPIKLSKHISFDKTEPVAVPPGSAPLEVGYTNASKTWEHIIGRDRLARWPYFSDWITLFINVSWDPVDLRTPSPTTKSPLS